MILNKNSYIYSMKLSEDKIQSDCFLWLYNQYPNTRRLLYHIPNGGLRNPKEANKLKAMGVVPGIPDLCLAIPSGQYSALYIEMKTTSGITSEAQKQVHSILELAGNKVVIVKSFDEFKIVVLDYLNKSKKYECICRN
jgi:hypothetical protein